jgi:hypothetical protein
MLNERDMRDSSMGVIRMDQFIRNAYMAIQAQLPLQESVTASAGTISSDTFTLPTASNAEYSGLVWIRLRSTGDFLTQLTTEEMTALRTGNATIPTARPQYFALYEGSDQVVNGICESIPSAAETYDLHRTMVAGDFDTTAMDSTSIALGRYGVLALVSQSAAMIAASLTAEDMAKRRLNPSIIPVWFEEARVMTHKEAVRRNDLESVGREQRWVP